MTTLPLVERFTSIQGEGLNAGWPAHFIRYAGCNLDCVFADGSICDTPWQTAREHPDLDSVIEEAAAALPETGWVIVTGGEPTIQPTLPALLEGLTDRGLRVAIESNATRWLPELALADHLTASPKHLVSHRRSVVPDPDPEFIHRAHELRLVVTADTPPQVYSQVRCPRYASPATIADGSGSLEFEGFATGAVKRALLMVERYGWRLSVQAHKMMGLR